MEVLTQLKNRPADQIVKGSFSDLKNSVQKCLTTIKALDRELARYDIDKIISFAVELNDYLDPNLLDEDSIIPDKVRALLKMCYSYFQSSSCKHALVRYLVENSVDSIRKSKPLSSIDNLAIELLDFWYEPDVLFKEVAKQQAKNIAQKLFNSGVLVEEFGPDESRDLSDDRKINIIKEAVRLSANAMQIPEPNRLKTHVHHDGPGKFVEHYYSLMVSIYEHKRGSAKIISEDLSCTSAHEMRHAFQAMAANWLSKNLDLPMVFKEQEWTVDYGNHSNSIFSSFQDEALMFYLLLTRENYLLGFHNFKPAIDCVDEPESYIERDARGFDLMVSEELDALISAK